VHHKRRAGACNRITKCVPGPLLCLKLHHPTQFKFLSAIFASSRWVGRTTEESISVRDLQEEINEHLLWYHGWKGFPLCDYFLPPFWTQFSEFKSLGAILTSGTSWLEAWNLQGGSAEAWNSRCWKSHLLWIWRVAFPDRPWWFGEKIERVCCHYCIFTVWFFTYSHP
jgi:hypothetical protein